MRTSVCCLGLLLLVSASAVWSQESVPAGLVVVADSGQAPIDPRQAGSAGEVELIVRLRDAPLAAVNPANSKRLGNRMSGAQQRVYLDSLRVKQDTLMQEIRALGGREIARLNKSLNAVIVAIDSARIPALKALPNVVLVRPVLNYRLVLGETVPYIGATALHASGYSGDGITVAVLDSGIDYTHANLGGPGTAAAYQAAYGLAPGDPANTTRDGLFPTAKVIEGFDFVGEAWPNGPRAPDPDPIDFEGHGTHVADIIAGNDGSFHRGVAPGARLLAIKTCSAVSTSCNGIALLQGMDFALDPNGDGDIFDAADVINLSLASDYGMREDDLSEACTIASAYGIVVVAAAGNAGDKPYVLGSPASSPAVIGVVETQVPSATLYPLVINSPAGIAGTYPNTASVDWAPINTNVTGSVVFVGRGCPAGSVSGQPGEDPYLANPAGRVALIDRGACNVSLKVDRAAQAGAIGALIGLVAAGDAVGFAYGGGSVFVPTLVITQATANLLKANLAAPPIVSYGPTMTIPLAQSMVAGSSRGPGYSYNSIKPDIAAPGASVSAVAGTGMGEQAFGGTSGAAPMVAGAAALLLEEFPFRAPHEIKAMLVNTAEINIFVNPATQPGVLAPVTRIGGGEVRVNRAGLATTAAWDAGDPASTSLSFGFWRLIGVNQFKKKVLVRNYDGTSRTYAIAPSFRYATDAASGAVVLSAPPSVTVPANGSGTFVLTATVNANLLPAWILNGGSQGGNGPLLQSAEYDGYVQISDGADTVRLPWHILPHPAANVRLAASTIALGGASSGTLQLTNTGGSIPGPVDVFSLTGTSPRLPASTLPRPGDNFAVVDLKSVGVRMISLGGGQFGVQFAVNTWGERSHPNYPAEFDVFIDVNRDGTDDYVMFTAENGGVGASGQNVTAIYNLATSTTVVQFFTDADLGSANASLTASLSAVGLMPSTQFDFRVIARDNYFTGAFTDVIGTMTYQLDTPRFSATGLTVPVNGTVMLNISSNPAGAAQSPSQSGLLLMHRNARKGFEADAVVIFP